MDDKRVRSTRINKKSNSHALVAKLSLQRPMHYKTSYDTKMFMDFQWAFKDNDIVMTTLKIF